VSPHDDAALFDLGQRFANRRAAHLKTLAEFGFGRKHAIRAREFIGANASEDFLRDLAREGNVTANHFVRLCQNSSDDSRLTTRIISKSARLSKNKRADFSHRLVVNLFFRRQ
jgi:hypothetical protein